VSELTLEQLIAAASERAHLLFEGTEVAHRSCGITIAETFGRATAPYQALRRGGITGCGECGAIRAGELVLGELLGDPDPTGAVTPALRTAAFRYRELWQQTVDRGGATTLVCNDLTGQFGDFTGPDRRAFCTRIATAVAGAVATTLAEQGALPALPPQPAR